MPKLTQRFIESLKKEKGDLTVFDGGVPGFGFHVRPSGHCTFVLQYRAGGCSRKLTLGIYPRVSPVRARKKALLALAAIEKGNDPALIRDLDRAAPTVSDLAKRYLTEYLEPKRKASTVREFRRTIEKEILPRLGRRKVAEVTLADVDKLHRSLRETPYQANRTVSVLSSMLARAEKWGIRPPSSNPCRHVERFSEKARERFLSSAEFARLGETLRLMEGQIHPSGLLAIRLLILTGMRKGEVLSLKWEYLDFPGARISLPESKTGRKVLPLTAPVQKILVGADRTTGNPYVCRGDNSNRPLVGLQKIWERVRVRAGLENVRLHDLRHSFASVGAGAGLGLYMIGKILGHTQARTTQRYAHLADDPIKAASEQISSEIAASLEDKSNGPTIAVTAFRATRDS